MFRALGVNRQPSREPAPPIAVFHPATYSKEELQFLVQHLGESSAVALHARELPAGVNEAAVRPLLERVFTLEELRAIRQMPWAGIDALKDSSVRYLSWMVKSEAVYERTKRTANPIRHPSQAMFDGRKRMIEGAVGADSKNMVVSEILSDGTRRPFAVDLMDANAADALADALADPLGPVLGVQVQSAPTYDTLIEDVDNGVLTCPICKYTQNYDVNRRSTRSLATARIMKHLLQAKLEVDRHRILLARLRA